MSRDVFASVVTIAKDDREFLCLRKGWLEIFGRRVRREGLLQVLGVKEDASAYIYTHTHI